MADDTFPITCAGPGPHEPEDGILGTSTAPNQTGLCPLCAALNPEPVQRPPLDPSIEPAISPRDLAAVRERII